MTSPKLLAAMGGGGPANYIEDVFSTWLYTGNGSTQTINNGIDLAGKGGLVWIKSRNGAYNHGLVDTARGAGQYLSSNTTVGNTSTAGEFTGFTSTGFGLDSLVSQIFNANLVTYASWTFRKQAKFFDVVTYTGNGVAGRTIAHSLGSVPGFIIVKRLETTGAWAIYHRSTGGTQYLGFDTGAAVTDSTFWNNTDPTSTVFTVGAGGRVNANGGTYVAYLFAHDAGGFGAFGTDSVISCGSFTGNQSEDGPVINLGWEPQWVLIKNVNQNYPWYLFDSMRGMTMGGDTTLSPTYTSAENFDGGLLDFLNPTPTGFKVTLPYANINGNGNQHIYIAIRRPMKVPTSGASVFSPATSSAISGVITSGFPTDMVMSFDRTTGISPYNRGLQDRLRGDFLVLSSAQTDPDLFNGSTVSFNSNSGIVLNGGSVYANGYVYEQFRRAPGFFDVVCYTGTGVARTVNHNLGVTPELMIVKCRSTTGAWYVYHSFTGGTQRMLLDSTAAANTQANTWNNTAPTSSVFTVGSLAAINASGQTFVAYLFASLPSVSKVGNYTGNGSSQTINCGFAAGARFVLIKRTDAIGSWYVWDTARGIVSGNDPYLLLNSTAAEVTTDDSIDPDSSGFIVNQLAATNINVNGATYIYLAIA